MIVEILKNFERLNILNNITGPIFHSSQYVNRLTFRYTCETKLPVIDIMPWIRTCGCIRWPYITMVNHTSIILNQLQELVIRGWRVFSICRCTFTKIKVKYGCITSSNWYTHFITNADCGPGSYSLASRVIVYRQVKETLFDVIYFFDLNS